jgi:hypothetical protein
VFAQATLFVSDLQHKQTKPAKGQDLSLKATSLIELLCLRKNSEQIIDVTSVPSQLRGKQRLHHME